MFLPLSSIAACAAVLACACVARSYAAEPLPSDERYCVVDADGHLSIGGERVRFWGAIGNFPGPQVTIDGDPYAFQRRILDRMEAMNFNLVRHWEFPSGPYQKGDLSPQDLNDFFLAECGRRGIRIWAAGATRSSLYLRDIDAAAAMIDDPDTEEAWKAAIRGLAKVHWWSDGELAVELGHGGVMTVWDPRLEAWVRHQTQQNLDHVNRHNGLRWADDPVMAVWELSNEQWWTSRMTSGAWQRLPSFFKAQLLDRWHGFLREKYSTQAALEQAWGFLLPGESLAGGTVLFAPMGQAGAPDDFNDGSEQARAAFAGAGGSWGRDEFTRQRGEDVLEFLIDTLLQHKRRLADGLKQSGKSCRLSPLLYDTGIGYDPASQYLHQQADAVAHDAYMEGLELKKIDPSHKRYPFYSGLDNPPRCGKDVPWLEHNKVAGKPFLCYETQLGAPTKYRAEWPMRIAALASIQDWDAVCWHYWGTTEYDFTRERPFDGKIAGKGSGQYQYHYTFDEVECAAISAAGAIFRSQGLEPAPDPTIYRYGRPALYDPASMDYAGGYGREGLNMLPTTYRHGVRIELDPAQEEFLVVEGPQVRLNGFEQPVPIRPNDQIAFDFHQGHLLFDSPSVAGYTGFLAQYPEDQLAFANGVVLSDVTLVNPPGRPYPITPDENYCSFALVATDGRPLAQSASILVTLVSSAFNSGTFIDLSGAGKHDYGELPVLVTRVGARVQSPALVGMAYRMIDFNEETLTAGTVGEDGQLQIPVDLPVWQVLLTR